MTDTVGAAIIELGVDASGVDAGLARVDSGVERTGRNLSNLGARGSAALESIGAGSTTAAARVDNTTRSLIGSVERATAALEAGKKSGADYFETLARNRGADLGQLAPYIAQLREVETAQTRAAAAANETRIAQEAAAEAARAESAAQREVAQALAGREAFLSGLREQIALYGRSSEEVMRYRAAQAGVEVDAAPLIAELHNLRNAHEEVTAAARAEAQAQREAAQVQTNQSTFIASLEQQATAIGRTRSQLLELQAAQLGVSDQAAPFIARLREAEGGLNRTGISAGQTAAALRGVPAQFTDIVTSIQAGQAPLTVFLQQGGQLRDMFGGAAPAARALGGYIVGLVNPFTLAAAGAAALALAYNQGSKEADAYARALILTGNAAGTTTGQLTDMARAISKTVGTQGDAAAALAALAGTGKVGVENLQRFATVAVKAQRDIGVATADTAKDFADLAKSPLQASERLNEQYHYLTGAIYAQIKALQDQGRIEEAGEVAQRAYAEALESRSDKMKERLGVVEKAWAGIKGAAKDAWDAMLNVGREDTLEQQLAKVQTRLQAAQAKHSGQKSMLGGSTGFDTSAGDAAVSRQEQGYVVLERLLKGQISLRKDEAVAEGEANKKREAGVEWAKQLNANLSRQKQLYNELEAVRAKGAAAGASERAILIAQGEVRKKYADIYNDAIDAQIEKIKQRAAIEQEADKRSGISLALARATGLASSYDLDIEYARKIEALDQAALTRDKEKLQAELALTKQKLNSQKEQADIQAQINLLDEKSLTRKAELEKQVTDLDVKNTRQAADALADLADKRSSDLQALKDQLTAQQDANSLIGASTEQVNAFNKSLVNERATRLEVQAAIIGQTESRKEEAEAMLASAAAMRSLAQSQADGLIKSAQFEQQKKLWESIDQTAHDTFVNIFNDGKSAFDRLRDTLKSGLLDLLYQMTVKKWIFSIGAEVSGYAGIANLAGATAGATGSPGVGSSLGSAANLFSAGKAIYSGFSTGITSSLGGSIASMGNLFGSQAVSAFGAGMQGGLTGAMAAAGPGATATSATAAGLGSSAAAAIPIIGWIIAGMQAASSFRAQGFDPNNGTTSTLGQVVGAVPLLLNKQLQQLGVGSALANILTGASINTKLFGRANPVVESQGLRGTINTSGIDADSYAKILEKGGWFRSDNRYEKTVGLDPTTDAAYDTTITAMVSAVKGFAKALGLQADQINSYTKSFDIALTGDAEKDGAAITKLFSDVGDELSTKLLPTLSTYKAENETLATTLQRLAADYVSVDSVLAAMGQSIKTVGDAGIKSREGLIAAAGGLGQLSSGAAFFAQNFLSPAEQMAPIVANVKKQLADLGAAGTNTDEQFKQLVLGLDLSTDAGAKQYAALLQLAPQFKQVTSYMGSLDAALVSSTTALSERAELQKQYDDATLTEAQKIAKQRAALDPSNKGLFDQVQAAQAAKTAAEGLASVNAEYQKQIDDFIKSTLSATDLRALETKGMDASTLALYDRLAGLKAESLAQQQAADAIQKAKDAAVASAKASADLFQSFGDAMVETMKNAEAAGKSLVEFNKSLLLGDLSPLSPEQRYQEAKKQFLAAEPTDTQAATAFLNASKDRDAGDFSYSRDFALVQSRIAQAATDQFNLAASIPAAWAAFSQVYRDKMAPATYSPGQYLVDASSTATTGTRSVEEALEKMADKVVSALAPIAVSTEKQASMFDMVTEGGTNMVVTQ
ncbi:hypothetical protein GTP46_24455 [Duganella sp. FT135W]|uniref:Bacteriophage tail tape measure N-terminal domain-containing protein n=1 Tax=Duganella flavida TaxID=2692175 RepID=A0A6L8KIX4_9BURK|nr:phage tail length tape measure family protein [Duganella flavida]MYM25784.1 hypothetical protein [Duganella flavida]